jgi:hypothetical protein
MNTLEDVDQEPLASAVAELLDVNLLVNFVSDLEDVDQEVPVSADSEMQDVNLMQTAVTGKIPGDASPQAPESALDPRKLWTPESALDPRKSF